MKLNDKKILASAYLDQALTPEEKHWAETEFSNDLEIQTHLDSCKKLSRLTHQNLTSPEMPHTLEYNWQKCRAAIRTTPESSWQSVISSIWFPKLAWAALGLLTIMGVTLWQFNLSKPTSILAKNENTFSEPSAHVQTITLPVSYSQTPSIDRAWSPKPEISVSSFPAGKASVIWLSGMPYRSETNLIK